MCVCQQSEKEGVPPGPPECGLQVPGVAHELPPVHGGVVDAVVLVLVGVVVVVQSSRAFLTRPSRVHPRGEKG